MGTASLMRVVLDSNILLSALLSPHGAPHRIFQLWHAKRFELVTCPTQLDEIRRASRYPKLRELLQPHRVGAMVNALAAHAMPDPPLDSHEADDPDDAWLKRPTRTGWLLAIGIPSFALGRVGWARIVTAATSCGMKV